MFESNHTTYELIFYLLLPVLVLMLVGIRLKSTEAIKAFKKSIIPLVLSITFCLIESFFIINDLHLKKMLVWFVIFGLLFCLSLSGYVYFLIKGLEFINQYLSILLLKKRRTYVYSHKCVIGQWILCSTFIFLGFIKFILFIMALH